MSHFSLLPYGPYVAIRCHMSPYVAIVYDWMGNATPCGTRVKELPSVKILSQPLHLKRALHKGGGSW